MIEKFVSLKAVPYMLAAIVALCAALGVSVRYNLTQWADARAADAALEGKLKLAEAQGRAAVLARNAELAEEFVDAAEEQRILLERQQGEFIAQQDRRQRVYWDRMSGLTIACGPGEEFVDAFNDAVQP
jgi:hypothetical protein